MITKQQLTNEVQSLQEEQKKVGMNAIAISKEKKRLAQQEDQNNTNGIAISGALQLAENLLKRIEDQEKEEQPETAPTPTVINDPQ